MLVGLISDTHDNMDRTTAALGLFEDHEPERLLHAGDLTSGRLVPFFVGWQVDLAEGNVDAPGSIQEAIGTHEVDMRYAVKHELDLDGAHVGLIHGDDKQRLQGMVNSGAFDLVVHGHTHTFRDTTIGRTRVVNPGAVHRSSAPSVCLYDTRTGELERLQL